MCDYCDMTDVNVEHACKDYFIHKPFYLVNEHTHEILKANGNNPVLYLREYREVDHWSLICEFADDAGTVVEATVSHCPRCGRKLEGTNKEG